MSKMKSLFNALLLLVATTAIATVPVRAADDGGARLPQLTGIMPGPKAVGTITQYMLWKNTSGQYSLWDMDAKGNYNYFLYGPNANWTVTDFKAGYDGRAKMLWTNTDGEQSLYNVASDGSFAYNLFGPYLNWTIKSFAPDPDFNYQLLWDNTNGEASLWDYTFSTSSTTGSYSYFLYPGATGWSANQISIGANQDPMLLWQRSDNLTAVWTVDPTNGGRYTYSAYGPYTDQGWYSKFIATGIDNITRLAWQNTNGSVSLWTITNSPDKGDYTYYTYTPTTPLQLKGLSVDRDLNPHLFFVSSTGAAQLWTVDHSTGNYKYIQFGPYPNYTPVYYAAIYESPLALPMGF